MTNVKWYKNGVEITGLLSTTTSLALYTASGSYASNSVAYMSDAVIAGMGIIAVTGGEKFKAVITYGDKSGTTAEVTVTVQ